jgi:hypothetical protein
MLADQFTPKSKKLEKKSNASVPVTNSASEPEALLFLTTSSRFNPAASIWPNA